VRQMYLAHLTPTELCGRPFGYWSGRFSLVLRLAVGHGLVHSLDAACQVRAEIFADPLDIER
jgi:hypothetical protein